MPETIYCAGKTKEQLLGILKTFRDRKCSVLGTRCSPEQAAFVKDAGVTAEYDEVSRVITLAVGERYKLNGRIAVCTGGTADLPVAEEAAFTACWQRLKKSAKPILSLPLPEWKARWPA